MDRNRTTGRRSGESGRARRGRQQAEREERADRMGRRDRRRVRARIASTARGVLFGGAAYLLGGAPLAFGAAPFGLALLAAGTDYTWYIAAGLLCSALLRPITLRTAAWVGVYALCLLLRLAVLFFIDPPALPGEERVSGFRGAMRYARRYLGLCLRSMRGNLGTSRRARQEGDTDTDYYTGSPWERAERAREEPPFADLQGEDTEPVGTAGAPPADPLPEPLPDGVGLFCEHPFLRALCAALSGFAAGVVGLFAGGFHVYDLLGALLWVFVTPLVTLLLTLCFGRAGEELLFSPAPLRDAAGRRNPPTAGGKQLLTRFHLAPLLSCLTLLFSVCFCARAVSFPLGTPYLTIRLGVLLGLLFTLSAASRLGLLPGLAVALTVGLGAGAEILPLFLLTAAVYAFLRTLSHRSAVIGGVAAGGMWCAALGGTEGLLLDLPTVCLSVPIFFLCEQLWQRMPLSVAAEEQIETDFTLAVTCELRLRSGQERLEALSQALLEMSGRLSAAANPWEDHPDGDLDGAEAICRAAVAEVCGGCASGETCVVASELCEKLTEQVKKDRRVLPAWLATEMPDGCARAQELAAAVNRRLTQRAEEAARGSRTEVMATDYAHMAALLAEAAEGDPDETRCNREAADRVYDYLMGAGVAVQGVVVCGRNDRRVIVRGTRMDILRSQPRETAERLGELCGTRLSEPSFEERADGCVMTLLSLPRVEPHYAGSAVPGGSGRVPPPLSDECPGRYTPPAVCGDHIAIFRNEQACFYALISDGMGSGEAASAASEICAVFLERMLSAGSRLEISMRMLNSFLCARGHGSEDECSATVDLMELDTACGHAVFAKSGAAPTYVIRGGTVYKLRSRSQPLGILRDSEPQFLRFRMHPGDVVVMVSDGVTMGNDECPWLLDMLSEPLPDSMDSLRVDILRRAMQSGTPDDLSAIAIRIDQPTREAK